MPEDRRLIEDYLPIRAISAEASREKSVRKGHISTLHLWWARRPLVACRAAVYGALVPADQFEPKNGPPGKRKSLGRANAAKFLERLCKYPGNPQVIKEAQKHILDAHAERLTKQTGKQVTREDIEQGRTPRPKVLDIFAGGGAIPLEALRLGCEAHALELNPVAHIIELCTLVYPQKYGKPDANAQGMAGTKNEKGQTTWGGLANEVRYWGNWVLEKVRKEIGDLYPPIPDPEYKGEKPEIEFKNGHWVEKGTTANAIEEWATIDNVLPRGYLRPVAYLWTRTVQCKKPACGSTVPLVKQTWLCKKKGRYVALKVLAPKGEKKVYFKVIEATTEKSLNFDPSAGSTGGNATCPFCGTVADVEYIKSEGRAGRIDQQLMALACNRHGDRGKIYVSADSLDPFFLPDISEIEKRLNKVSSSTGIKIPDEPLPKPGTLGFRIQRYGLSCWGSLFSQRQMLSMVTFANAIRKAADKMKTKYDSEILKATLTLLGSILDRLADFNSNLCVFNYTGGRGVVHTFGRHALPMVWDYAETNPFNPEGASWISGIEDVPAAFQDANMDRVAEVQRGSATALPWADSAIDAVITDPPYYDNVPYADISDFFYIWLKRTIGDLYPDHFASQLTPKKLEIIAEPARHAGSKEKANQTYELMMVEAFNEVNRVLKSGAPLAVVYAHKTTLGWASLVDALRETGFVVTEAWPMETEKPGRLRAQESAALASSIFLIARKRDGMEIGLYEDEVRPELQVTVRKSVETLWDMKITGADLVISAVGAGLRAFTRFARVEYANGEEVPAERFLAEVETVVLENILRRLSKEVGTRGGEFSLEGLDPGTRFYILWRYTYKYSALDAGEAIVFANGTHVELDGPSGLSAGARALLEKKKGQYRLKDFSDRGGDKKLGLIREDGQPAPMIDALHRVLWLMENRPGELPGFLQEAQPNREQMRLVAQALAGPTLKGGELGNVSPHAELSALKKLTANWNSVIEGATITPREREAKDAGQISWLK